MDAARHARLGFWAHMAHWLFSPSYRRRDRLVRWAWRRAAADIADLGHESVVWRFVGEKEKRVHAGLDDGAREYVFHDAYRGAENARATVRHALGVASRPAQRGDRRPRRVRAPSAPQPVSGLLEPDTRTSLAEGLARVLPTLGLEARHGPSR